MITKHMDRQMVTSPVKKSKAVANRFSEKSVPLPADVMQRVVKVQGDEKVDVFDGDGTINKKPLDAELIAALDLYTNQDADTIIKALDNLALQFEDYPSDGAFANWTAAILYVIQKDNLRVNPLTNKGGDIMPDPELSVRDTDEKEVHEKYKKGTAEYWKDKLSKSTPNQQGEVVIAGHGYRKPWETQKIQIPKGTSLHFYVQDTEPLPETGSNVIEDIGSKTKGIRDWKAKKRNLNIAENEKKFDYGPGEFVHDYTITPSKPDDKVKGKPITFHERTKLSSILVANMGSVHLAICREIDWWGGFANMPGKVHKMPVDWKYVRQKDYTGYLGPNGEKPAPNEGSNLLEPFAFDSTPL
jgi:hypothetical protein